MTTAIVVAGALIGIGLLAIAFALTELAGAIRTIGHDRRVPKVKTDTYGSSLRLQ